MLRVLLIGAAIAASSLPAKAPESRRCRILLTNDDGVRAPGLVATYRELSKLCETVISAPAQDHSGASHAIFNTRGGVTVRRVVLADGVAGQAVEGSPAEAAVVGLYANGGPKAFDLVVSGVNRGENLGLGNLYSGTVNAAMEGALRGVPSIAVSQATAYGTDYGGSAAFARRMAETALRERLPAGVVLNVNIPKAPIRGVRVSVSGGLSTELQAFKADPKSPDETVWTPVIRLRPSATEPGDLRDYLAGYITITPLALDRTAASELSRLARWPPPSPE